MDWTFIKNCIMTQVIGVLKFYKLYFISCVSSTKFYGFHVNVYNNRFNSKLIVKNAIM